MKKRLMPLLLALVMCLSLCACGGGKVFDAQYNSIEEVVSMLAENYTGEEKEIQKIKENESICTYFRKEHKDKEIWKLLYNAKDKDGNTVFTMYDINALYNICNRPNGSHDDWYEFLNVGMDGSDRPFFQYSSSEMTEKRLLKMIKNKFKDPDSVSIDNAWICFALPSGASGSDFQMYEEGSRYKLFASIRAKNGFGAIDQSVCVAEGNIYNWTISIKETSMSGNLLTKPAQADGYGDWSRIF